MGLTWYWKCMGVLLIGIAFCSLTNAETNGSSTHSIRKPSKPLDLSVPITKIQLKLATLLNRGLDLALLLQTLINALMECLPAAPQKSSEAPFVLPEQLKQDINTRFQEHYLANFNTLIPKANLREYCNSTSYRTIHNFLWVESQGEEYRDWVRFFHRFGYPNIYIGVRALYEKNECPEDLIATLPTGPDSSNSKPASYNPTFIRGQVLMSDYSRESALLPLQSTCNITEIITNLIKSGALELLSLVETVVDQVATDPNLHFLVGKIQEPIKGPMFREFRLLDPVRDLFDLVHKAIVDNETIYWLLGVIEGLTGIDLTKLNLVEVVLNIAEALLWGNFDPVPPRPQPQP